MKQYYLRTCGPNGESYAGFKWPLEVGARVEAPDWSPAPVCGGGLHGLLMGAGNGSLLRWDADAVWVVFSSDADAIDLDGKHKVPWGVVEYAGDRVGATTHIVSLGADPSRCVGYMVTAGDGGTATAGTGGTIMVR